MSASCGVFSNLLLTNVPTLTSKRQPDTFKMPAFTLYGFRGSTNSDRVRLTLAEGGFTDYNFEIIDLPKGKQKVSFLPSLISLIHTYAYSHLRVFTLPLHIRNLINYNPLLIITAQSEDHLQRHPFGKIPVVSFPDFTLYESRAICKYLTRLYSFPLFPSSTNLKALALFEQAESVETQYFSEAAGKIAFEKFAKVMFMGMKADEEIVLKALKDLEGWRGVMDKLLEGKNFMAGETFSLIDIFYIPMVKRLEECGVGDVITGKGNLKAWWDRCRNRDSVRGLWRGDEEVRSAEVGIGTGS